MVGGSPHALRFVRAFILTLVCLFPLSVFPAISFAKDVTRREFVRWVVDGDTVVLGSGEKVRYADIDTPEVDKPFYEEATRRNMELVGQKSVSLVVCEEKHSDKYGRTLGWLYVDSLSVNEVLLREGLARALPIAPCGLKHKDENAAIERGARVKKLGIWSVLDKSRKRHRRR